MNKNLNRELIIKLLNKLGDASRKLEEVDAIRNALLDEIEVIEKEIAILRIDGVSWCKVEVIS